MKIHHKNEISVKIDQGKLLQNVDNLLVENGLLDPKLELEIFGPVEFLNHFFEKFIQTIKVVDIFLLIFRSETVALR